MTLPSTHFQLHTCGTEGRQENTAAWHPFLATKCRGRRLQQHTAARAPTVDAPTECIHSPSPQKTPHLDWLRWPTCTQRRAWQAWGNIWVTCWWLHQKCIKMHLDVHNMVGATSWKRHLTKGGRAHSLGQIPARRQSTKRGPPRCRTGPAAAPGLQVWASTFHYQLLAIAASNGEQWAGSQGLLSVPFAAYSLWHSLAHLRPSLLAGIPRSCFRDRTCIRMKQKKGDLSHHMTPKRDVAVPQSLHAAQNAATESTCTGVSPVGEILEKIAQLGLQGAVRRVGNYHACRPATQGPSRCSAFGTCQAADMSCDYIEGLRS